MSLLPATNPANVFFETQLIEEAPAKPYREGRRLGNRITCGVPVAYDLAALYADVGRELPFEVRTQLDQHEFWLLRLVCTLHIEPGSAVSWADFAVTFAHHPEIPQTAVILNEIGTTVIVLVDPADPPIAYDLYPKQVTDKVQVEHTVEISPSLKFGEISVSPGKDALTLKYEKLYPRITAHGKRESEIYWRFTPGTGSKVEEGIKEMDVIVRKRQGVAVQGTIRITGRGRRWGIIPDPVALDRQQFYF